MKRAISLVIAMFLLSFAGLFISEGPEGQEVLDSTVYGYVTDSETGDPIPDADVQFYDDRYSEWGWTVTDEEGYYEIVVQAGGRLNIWVDHPEYFSDYVEVDVVPAQDVQLDIELDLIDCIIMGTVETSDDGTIYDINIYVKPTGEDRGNVYGTEIGYSESTADYRTYMEAGTYILVVECEGYETYESEPITVEYGDRVYHNVTVEPEGTGIRGIVWNEQGDYIWDAVVQLYNEKSSYVETTEWDGRYFFSAPAGDYSIKVTQEGYKEYDGEVTIDEGEMLDYDIILEKEDPQSFIEKLISWIMDLLGMT